MSKDGIKRRTKIVLWVYLAGLILVFPFLLKFIITECKDSSKIPYETTDIAHYRETESLFKDQATNEMYKKWHNGIMPEKIEDFFTVIKYISKIGTHWGAEEYLEIVIEDEGKYQEYTTILLDGRETETFFYDIDFQEYVVNDEVFVWKRTFKEGVESVKTIYPSIRKILFNDITNTIIFISVYDGDSSGDWMSPSWVHYFSRFNIDVKNYYDGARIKIMT